MKSMSLSKMLILMAFCLLVSGCAGKQVKFTTPDNQQQYDFSKGKSLTAQSCGFQLLLLIPINVNRRAHQAYESLLEQAGPDAMVTDIKVQEKWFYAFVGTVYCTEMEGTAYPKVLAMQEK